MKTILLAEDDALIMKMYYRMLKPLYEVVVAYDGEVALETVGKIRPDLMFLDLNMPKMSGRQVLAAMREQGLIERVPVVVLSNDADEWSRLKVSELGAREFISKVDLELETLLEVCKRFLGE